MRIKPAMGNDDWRRWCRNVSASLQRLLPLAAALAFSTLLPAESPEPADLRQILDRLQRLEQANQELREEVRALKAELAARSGKTGDAAAPVEEKVAVLENRVEEQAQTKVESSQRLPVRLTGMVLFNSFLNSTNNGGAQYPTVAVPGYDRNAGGSMRQTTIGLNYGPSPAVLGGKISGSVVMDFWGGTGQPLDQLVRLRTGIIAIDWTTRRVAAGLDKPIFSPREPTSLAQVGVSPLTGAGNLWLWIPQVRFEQDVHLSGTSSLRAQIGVVQTRENYAQTSAPGYKPPDVASARPGLEGRFQFGHGSDRRVEIAPGFHFSTSHVAYKSVPSRLFSLDWFVRPLTSIEFSGAFFDGQNVAPLGAGGAGPGFAAFLGTDVRPVHSTGGWGQLTYRLNQRLSFNFFSGQHDNRDFDLQSGMVSKNMLFGGNFFLRLAPNVILSFESSQVRTNRIGASTVLNNHYDLALAYLF
ncbi:MAG: hypothetical protein LLG20_23685 [Acidobacteriales bacterium]|nr:hypothetical protein [Terriglobales bacterium]